MDREGKKGAFWMVPGERVEEERNGEKSDEQQ